MTSAPSRPATAVPGGLAGLADHVAGVAEEHAPRTDRDAAFPVPVLDELRRTGLLGLLVPPEHGGLGGTLRDMVDIGIRLGRADMSIAMIFVMHCQQVEATVRYSGEPLRSELLRRLGSGRHYLASVTTEAGKGGHLLTAHAALRRDGSHVEIDRHAPIVTGGAHADGFLITMRGSEDGSPQAVSLVYAHRDQLSVTVSGDWQPMGMRASHSIPLRLAGRVPAHQVIGAPGSFAEISTRIFAPMAHLGWSAAWLGTAAGALSRVLRLLRGPDGRTRFDLGSELLLTRLSRARQRLDTVHALLRRAEDLVCTAPDISVPRHQLLLNALKITAAEQCHRAVEDLVDAVGLRHGYLKDSPTRLELALRDLRSAALNYSNDRLHLADGRLALLDPEVRLA
ncbi:acyl-CoA dehydrogenase family protein [Streptomyces sp. YIM 98790]|uniref:acyl-CoA dehydrogenase family protein n=1 Tax=Streptomyces sp. YIM 98790 TaxID=2689077 RepID=UPI001408DBF0|nr:acyl-CoA dehydrogenase family protein [Streptomyces sp. YIM 98790]